MAVEARHLNLYLFPSQLIGKRQIMNPVEANSSIYNTQMGYTVPLSGTTTTENLLPAHSSVLIDSIPPEGAIKSDSGLSYNIPIPRKRSRDSINPFVSNPNPLSHKNCSFFSFLGEDISSSIHQQQLDIDRLISQHMEKVRMEIEEKRKRQARRIIQEIELGMIKRLKAKEEEIEKIGKLNWALEERVKSLCTENQVWRDLAQTNEATANALRRNLEQVLAQVKDEPTPGAGLEETAALMDEAQSCCGSSGDNEDQGKVEERGALARTGGERQYWAEDKSKCGPRWCRNCAKEESCVLLLPCRHLCLCTVCGSTLHTCPICKSSKNASVHVNMS